MKIGFIGTGNMGGAILKGYSSRAKEEGNQIIAYNRTRAKVEAIAKDHPMVIAADIKELVEEADIVLLGVEPQNFDDVMPQIAPYFTDEKIFISIAAGITIAYLEGHLGSGAKIVRTMPNTPIMFGLGTTAMVRNKNVTDADFEKAEAIFKAGGITGEVTEDLIGAVIGVSGSSPAYTYMYIDALTKVGAQNGMDEEMSKRFAAQAVMGAARMVMESDESPEQLRDNVCSPGGTTIEAVNKLIDNGFEEKVIEGAQASVDRAEEMSK